MWQLRAKALHQDLCLQGEDQNTSRFEGQILMIFWCSKVLFFSYKMRTKTNITRKLKHEVNVKTHDNNTHHFFNSCLNLTYLGSFFRHRFQPFWRLSRAMPQKKTSHSSSCEWSNTVPWEERPRPPGRLQVMSAQIFRENLEILDRDFYTRKHGNS